MAEHDWVLELGRALQRSAPWQHLSEKHIIDVHIPGRRFSTVMYVIGDDGGPAGFVMHVDDARDVMVVVSEREPLVVTLVKGTPRPPERDEFLLSLSVLEGLIGFDAAAVARGEQVTHQHHGAILMFGAPSRWVMIGRPFNERLPDFARESLGKVWQKALREYGDDGLTLAHLVQVVRFDGATVAERFLAQPDLQLSDDERRWFAAQRDAWTSIWEVTAVEPGRSISLRDHFTDVKRVVHEAVASRAVKVGHHALMRVVAVDDEAFIDCAHPDVLFDEEANEVCAEVATELGWPPHEPVSPDALRVDEVWFTMLDRWDEMVRSVKDTGEAMTPEGDPVVRVSLRYPIVGKRAELRRKVGAIRGATPVDDGWSVMDPEQPGRILGLVTIERRTLEAVALSRPRADRLAALVAEACGTHLGRPSRSEDDVDVIGDDADDPNYVTWPDEPLSALRGMTPRAAVQTLQGRVEVVRMIDAFERQEAELPADIRYDLNLLRRELGLLQ